MPTYQYRCTECDASIEVVQSFTDEALTTCEVCEGALRKVFSGVGVVFKGSGFYRNDSRSPSGPGASKSSTAGSDASGSGASTSDAAAGSSGATSSSTEGSSAATSANMGSTGASPSTSPSASS